MAPNRRSSVFSLILCLAIAAQPAWLCGANPPEQPGASAKTAPRIAGWAGLRRDDAIAVVSGCDDEEASLRRRVGLACGLQQSMLFASPILEKTGRLADLGLDELLADSGWSGAAPAPAADLERVHDALHENGDWPPVGGTTALLQRRYIAAWFATFGAFARSDEILGAALSQFKPRTTPEKNAYYGARLERAGALLELGDYKQALAHYKAAQKWFDSQGESGRLNAFIARLGKAHVYLRTAKYFAAKPELDRLRRAAKSAKALDSVPGKALFDAALLDAEVIVGAAIGIPWKSLIAKRRRSTQLWQSALGPAHPLSQTATELLSVQLFHSRQLDELIALLSETRAQRLDLAQRRLISEERVVRVALSRRMLRGRDLLISMAVIVEQPELSRLAGDDLLTWQWLEGEREASLARASDNRAIKRLRQLRKTYQQNVFSKPDVAERVLHLIDHVEQSLASTLSNRRWFDTRIGVGQIAANLADGDAWLDIRAYRPVNFHTHGSKQPRWLGLLLDAKGRLQLVDLGEVVATWPLLSRGSRSAKALKEKDPAAFYGYFLAAFDASLAQAERVFLSGEGMVNVFPVEAAEFPDGKRWVEKADILHLPNPRLLARAKPAKSARKKRSGPPLLIGGIDFDARRDARSKPSAEAKKNFISHGLIRPMFSKLPASTKEVLTVASQLKKHRFPKTQVWVGRRGTEARLKALDKPPELLHLATHGFFVRGMQGGDSLAMSGVALAGANLASEDGEDGILFANEVRSMDLDGTRLVVLSTCSTGVGQIDLLEGPQGMARAFSIAGANYLITARWQVPDYATKSFMAHFYKSWLQAGATDAAIGGAFSKTQRSYAKFSDKYEGGGAYWAAFSLYALNR